MTATLFQAERPPICFIMVSPTGNHQIRNMLTIFKAGSEGGMKRIIGCSYDWTTATFYRETVLRMQTQFEDSMNRISRVKIGFKRKQWPVGLVSEVGEPVGHQVQ
jgi:hypothetical protein